MRILIVDDDRDMLDVLRRVLVGEDHSVDCVDNAVEGIERVQASEYDFIVLDYKMPVNDGAWFLQKFRVPRKTKVLLITAFVDREVIRKMFSLGASGYLIKPFEKEDLLRHMNFLSPARAVACHAS